MLAILWIVLSIAAQSRPGSMAAMDFFVVPTATFRLLYVLVVMTHERRKVIHFNKRAPDWNASRSAGGAGDRWVSRLRRA